MTTREEILNMPAGRKMDALIAVSILGWEKGKWITPPENHPASINNWCAEWDDLGCPNWMPHYSTDISAAQEATEKWLDSHSDYAISIESVNTTSGRIYDIVLWGMDNDPVFTAKAETESLARCRCLLLAVMDGA